MTNYEALDKINRIANERFNLYRQASSSHLTPIQLQRLHEIENQLTVLWDEHRREVAAQYWGSRPRSERRFDFRDDRAFQSERPERSTRLEDGRRITDVRLPIDSDADFAALDADIEAADEDTLIA